MIEELHIRSSAEAIRNRMPLIYNRKLRFVLGAGVICIGAGFAALALVAKRPAATLVTQRIAGDNVAGANAPGLSLIRSTNVSGPDSGAKAIVDGGPSSIVNIPAQVQGNASVGTGGNTSNSANITANTSVDAGGNSGVHASASSSVNTGINASVNVGANALNASVYATRINSTALSSAGTVLPNVSDNRVENLHPPLSLSEPLETVVMGAVTLTTNGTADSKRGFPESTRLVGPSSRTASTYSTVVVRAVSASPALLVFRQVSSRTAYLVVEDPPKVRPRVQTTSSSTTSPTLGPSTTSRKPQLLAAAAKIAKIERLRRYRKSPGLASNETTADGAEDTDDDTFFESDDPETP